MTSICGRWSQSLLDSTTVREISLNSAGGKASPDRRRVTRLTVQRLDGRVAESTLQDLPVTACCPEPRLPRQLSDVVLRPDALGSDLTARVVSCAGARSYDDSDGRRHTVTSEWIDVAVRADRVGAPPLSLRGGTGDVGDVSRLLDELTYELRGVPAGPLAPLTRRRADLVLAPQVAAVLVHELVGHGAEEIAQSATPMTVGPSELSVTADFPGAGPDDDEGVPAASVTLVGNGMLCAPVLDRQRAALEGGSPAGLAQAAWHAGPPRARCTHLMVAAGTAGAVPWASMAEGLWCTSASGAEFINGTGVVAVERSWRVTGGRLVEPLRPFLLSVSMRRLVRHLIGIGGDRMRTRAGRCVKGAQSLPTSARVPSLVMEDVPVHAY